MSIGDIVYLVTDPEQKERIITGIFIRENNSKSYELCLGTEVTCHYQCEITTEKNIKKSLDL